MDALLILAIEAEKEAKRQKTAEPVCKMASSVDDVQKAVLNIAIGLGKLSSEVAEVAEIAKVAANKKMPKPAKPSDYVMDVVRDDKDKITRIDVRVV